jgi:hypothetical protein
MELNVLLRGQSNAGMLVRSPDWGAVATQIEQLLGFDGTTNKVNLLEKDSDSANDNTVTGGTAFIGDWVQPVNGNWQHGWTDKALEQGLLNYIAGLPADERAAPTAIVWLHNEYDSTNPDLSTPEWMSAVRFEAQQVRQALGQSPATTPYVFVNAIPYGYNVIPAVNQDIKLGMELLAADPGFHAAIGAQANDVNMDYGQDGTYGGAHMNTADANEVDHRLAVSIAEEFAQYALPGSPVATGQVDGYGPEVVAAQRVGSNQVLVTVALDHAPLEATLSADAAKGGGWSIIDGGRTLDATAAQVTDGSHVLLTFASPVPTDDSIWLFYAYGYGRLATGSKDPGIGNAVYDSQNMPISAPATGVPVLSGSGAGQFTEQNLVTGTAATVQGTASSLPGYQSEFIAVAPDSVRVTAMTPNAFIIGGQGVDELVATSGTNLLDAGQGTALMVGGSGQDYFVIDGRGPATWDAVANFHAGDTVVLWGATQGVSKLAWTDTGQGQAILTVSGGGVTSSAIGFVGVSVSAAQHFVVGGGTAGGLNYLTITAA